MTEADEPAVLVDRAGGVMTITLNRPRARNAINHAVATAMSAALDELDASADLTVGVITGAGGAFCAGMDLKAFVAGEAVTSPTRGFAGICERPAAKPLIAAVEGWALAGGCEIALACDIIVAAETARFGLPEVKRGLFAAAGGLIRLPHRVPPGLAMMVALTGDPIDAAAAAAAGLVTVVAAEGRALATAQELAGRIAANGPLAVAATKAVVQETAGRSDAEAWAIQLEHYARVSTSEDAREGATAFAEKRPPVWRGR
jgi:enoyl-CoA hydratase